MNIPTQKLSDLAKLPQYSSEEAAGADLYAAENVIIASGERALIKTNIALAIPEGYYGRIAPRSGLAYKNGIDVMAGVIDSDYRGDVGVILLNTGKNPFVVSVGDRIAQIIFQRYFKAAFLEKDSLEDSKRGSGGFGSTGV